MNLTTKRGNEKACELLILIHPAHIHHSGWCPKYAQLVLWYGIITNTVYVPNICQDKCRLQLENN